MKLLKEKVKLHNEKTEAMFNTLSKYHDMKNDKHILVGKHSIYVYGGVFYMTKNDHWYVYTNDDRFHSTICGPLTFNGAVYNLCRLFGFDIDFDRSVLTADDKNNMLYSYFSTFEEVDEFEKSIPKLKDKKP